MNKETKESRNVLVWRDEEWHLLDRMAINANKIVFIEPVSREPTVARPMVESRKQSLDQGGAAMSKPPARSVPPCVLYLLCVLVVCLPAARADQVSSKWTGAQESAIWNEPLSSNPQQAPNKSGNPSNVAIPPLYSVLLDMAAGVNTKNLESSSRQMSSHSLVQGDGGLSAWGSIMVSGGGSSTTPGSFEKRGSLHILKPGDKMEAGDVSNTLGKGVQAWDPGKLRATGQFPNDSSSYLYSGSGGEVAAGALTNDGDMQRWAGGQVTVNGLSTNDYHRGASNPQLWSAAQGFANEGEVYVDSGSTLNASGGAFTNEEDHPGVLSWGPFTIYRTLKHQGAGLSVVIEDNASIRPGGQSLNGAGGAVAHLQTNNGTLYLEKQSPVDFVPVQAGLTNNGYMQLLNNQMTADGPLINNSNWRWNSQPFGPSTPASSGFTNQVWVAIESDATVDAGIIYTPQGGAARVGGSLLPSGGRVRPDNPPGTLHAASDYEQTGGMLVMQLESLTSYSQPSTDGNATLGGVLQEALAGYDPALSDALISTYSYGANDPVLGVAAAPEPGAYSLIATVMLAAAVLYRRRKALRS